MRELTYLLYRVSSNTSASKFCFSFTQCYLIMRILDYSKQIGKKIIINSTTRIVIEIEKICYIKKEIDIADIYLIDGSHFSEIKSLKEYEKKLCQYGFYRINRDTIINGNYIKEIKINKHCREIKIFEKKFEVSFRRLKHIKEVLL